MELRENARRVSTRPLVLIVALLSALAIGLVGLYALESSTAPTSVGTGTPFAFYQDRPGPDSPSRNRPPSQDAWEGHGH